jgi:hypothetical protein
MKPADNINEFFRKAAMNTNPRMDQAVLDKVLTAHIKATNTPALAEPALRRPIMRSPIAKLGVAAAAIIAVIVLGLFEFVGTEGKSGVVWAQVAQRVDASRGFSYRTQTTQTQADWDQPMDSSTMTYYCPKHGIRTTGIEGPAIDSYISFDEGTRVALFHAMKRYTQRTLPPLPDGADAAQTGDMPRAMIRQFTAGDYKELGRRTINGVEAEGIETHDPAGFGGNFQVDSRTAQLWVSVEMGYPVVIESDVVGNNGTLRIKTVIDQFQWDVEFDPSEFKTVIPPDYQPLEILPGGGMGGWSDGR